MTRAPRLAVLLAAGLAALAAAPARGALETVLQDDATLLYRPTEQVTAAMARLKALGVDRVRLTANWSVLTRDADAARRPAGFDARDPAAYEQARWRGLDQAVRLARAAGLKVLLDVGFRAPRWATTDALGERGRTNVDPAAFADFAAALARRYSGAFVPPPDVAVAPPPPVQDQSFLLALLGQKPPPRPPPPPPGRPLDLVDEFVLWNEPNHPALLQPQWHGTRRTATPASPALYGRMLRAAYSAAKGLRPDATFLAGNTSSGGSRPGHGGVPPLRFIRELACVDARLRPRTTGACAHFTMVPGDGWAHHPYTRNQRPDLRSARTHPDNVGIADLDRMSALLRHLVARGRLAPGLQRIHLTEFGYETHPVGRRPTVSLGTQARWLTWAEYLSSRVPGVVSFAQFLLRDQPPGPLRVSDSAARAFGQYYTGLQTSDGADKPVAKSFTAGLFAQRRAGGRVLLWGRLRLGDGSKLIHVEQRRAGDAWTSLLRIRVGGQSSFTRTVREAAGASYRLRWPLPGGGTATGLAIAPVAADPPPQPRASRLSVRCGARGGCNPSRHP